MSRPRASVITARALKDRCAGVVTSILNRQLATKEDVDAWRPGGARNADTTVWGWFAFHSQLMALSERDHLQAARRESANRSGTDEVALLAMLGGRGESFDLVTPLPDGELEVLALTVWPKGLQALTEVQDLDQDCRWLAARLVVLQELIDEGLASAGDLQAAEQTSARIVEYTARIAWILTSPGAECPYDPGVGPGDAMPKRYLHLDPLDLTALLLVHRRVNNARLLALAPFIPRDPASAKAAQSWAVIMAATGREIHEDPEHLIKAWPLQKVVASAALAAKARLDAEAAAKVAAAQQRT